MMPNSLLHQSSEPESVMGSGASNSQLSVAMAPYNSWSLVNIIVEELIISKEILNYSKYLSEKGLLKRSLWTTKKIMNNNYWTSTLVVNYLY